MNLVNLRIAVFGLGRSGMAVARAALKLGAEVSAFDSGKPTIEQAYELGRLGVDLHTSWSDSFDSRKIDWIVVNPAIAMRHPALQDAVGQGIEVIGEIEFAYRISKSPILAITGTNGKSTTTVMASLCLAAGDARPILCGNVYGSGYDEITLTEAAEVGTEGNVLVAEISSFQLEWVRDFKPRAAAITNIAPDHLDRYADFGEYAATKRRIYSRMDCNNTIVVNENDLSGHPTVPLVANEVKFDQVGQTAYVSEDRLVFEASRYRLAELGLRQDHNTTNAMMALCLARSVSPNVEAKSLVNGLARFKGLRHRMEILGERDGVLLINNSMCTNPSAVITSSESVDRTQHLLIGGINKGLDFKSLGEFLRKSQHKVYLFGTDARPILKELEIDAPVFGSMEQAFYVASENAKSGEAILLAPGCASKDQFTDFRARGEAFRKVAKEWLDR